MRDGDDTRSQATADPIAERAPADASGSSAFAQIAFHSDLRRIGQRFVFERGSVVVGRANPLFAGRPLLDPCVSRKQIEVAWDAASRVFRTRVYGDARRKVRLLGGGAPGNAAELSLPPGSLLAIGDRVILAFELSALDADDEYEGLWGDSPPMLALRGRIDALAASDDTVLVTGETGTGKELVARALHERSPRKNGPFIPVNCAALPEQLMDSELFGHERGAFTGATNPREGLFRSATNGTLFLDEVAELSLTAQAKLLRVLQEHTVRTVGRDAERFVDVRVVAATNQSLQDAVRAGRFRLDLSTRLDGLSIRVPPLRMRRSDIPKLFVRFLLRELEARQLREPAWLVRDASLYPPPVPFDFWRALLEHDWPGNVRQLERLAVAAATLSAAEAKFVVPELENDAAPALATSTAPAPRRARPTRDELIEALKAHDYVQNRAARALAVPQASLARWMIEEEIPRPNELGSAAIEQALERADGDLQATARALEVSPRGLKLRIIELGLEAKLAR